jgi:hypothetical protein
LGVFIFSGQPMAIYMIAFFGIALNNLVCMIVDVVMATKLMNLIVNYAI